MLLIAAMLGQTNRLGLTNIIVQHQFRDTVGHGLKKLIALINLQLPRQHQLIEQNFDINLVV